MTEKKSSFLAWFNALGTFITVGALVFYGGSLWSTVNAHENRIKTLETHGSSVTQRHEAMDQERIDAIKARLYLIEQAIVSLADLKGDIKVIQNKIDQLQADFTKREDRSTVNRPNRPNPPTQ